MVIESRIGRMRNHHLCLLDAVKMYLPPDFSVIDAIACGKLIDQAYDQFNKASAVTPSPVVWSVQDGYTGHGTFSAVENGKILPFGFVPSKNGNLDVVIRGTKTPLEWLDDGSIQPIAFMPGWGTTTIGFRSLHDQIFWNHTSSGVPGHSKRSTQVRCGSQPRCCPSEPHSRKPDRGINRCSRQHCRLHILWTTRGRPGLHGSVQAKIAPRLENLQYRRPSANFASFYF
jgi:hypothetical protein